VARDELGATYGPAVHARVRRGGVAYLEVSSLVEPGKLAPVLGAVKRTLASIGMQPASAEELAAELAAVSADDIRTGFQSCLSANPTLSLVGDEKNVRDAVQAGWR